MKENKNSVCEEKNYEEIYKSKSKSIYNYIYYKCGDSNQAADLVQGAFIKLWHNCAKVPFEKAGGFLYRVVNNAFLNEVAHNKIILKHQKKQIDSVNNNTPHFEMELDEFDNRLKDAISSLTPAQREAFLLNRIDGKKYREIAEILGISRKAVEKRIHGALVSLKEKIGDYKI